MIQYINKFIDSYVIFKKNQMFIIFLQYILSHIQKFNVNISGAKLAPFLKTQKRFI